jgi:hypothetical protein
MPRGIAIDTTPEGILEMRGKHGQAPVPLQVPGGALIAQGFQSAAANGVAPVTGADFVKRMQDGLAKYKALMAAQAQANAAVQAAAPGS